MVFSALQVYSQTGLTRSELLRRQHPIGEQRHSTATSGPLKHSNAKIIWVQCEQNGMISCLLTDECITTLQHKKVVNSNVGLPYNNDQNCGGSYMFAEPLELYIMRHEY